MDTTYIVCMVIAGFSVSVLAIGGLSNSHILHGQISLERYMEERFLKKCEKMLRQDLIRDHRGHPDLTVYEIIISEFLKDENWRTFGSHAIERNLIYFLRSLMRGDTLDYMGQGREIRKFIRLSDLEEQVLKALETLPRRGSLEERFFMGDSNPL